MIEQGIGFAVRVLDLLGEVEPFMLACASALVIRSGLQALLVVVNLCLLLELVATLASPYSFGGLLAERLVASALQVATAYLAITWWRSRRLDSHSMSAR